MRKTPLYISLLISYLCGYNPASGQAPKDSSVWRGWSFEFGGQWGRIIRHTPSILIPIEHNNLGFELSAECQLHGGRGQDWHRWANYPRAGLLVGYQDFVDPRLGRGFGVMGHIAMDFYRSRNHNFRIFGRLALGFGYLTEHYSLPSNPTNNIVGSNLNNNTAFRLGMDIKLAANWRLRPSASFTHYSNAASQFPNLGINYAALHLGLVYTPSPIETADLPKRERGERGAHRRRYVGSFGLAVGQRESTTYGGPKYPVFFGSLEGAKFISNIHRLRVAAEYEYLGATAAFLNNQGTITQREAQWQASRLAVSGGIEFVWGRISLTAAYGFYLTRHALQPQTQFCRFTGRFYPFARPLAAERHKAEPYLIMGLKTHRITAEYAFFGIGCGF